LILLALAACGEAAAPNPPEPPPDPGAMHVTITGARTHESSWGAFGEFRDILAADTGELSLLGGQSLDTAVARNMTLIFPGRLDNGSFAMGRYVYGTIPSQPAAYVILDTSFFASIPGGTLTIASADYPPRPGLNFGLMGGTMTFRAVRLTGGPTDPIETRDTINVTVNFNAHWYHYLRPNIAVSVTGGPVPGSSLVTIGQAIDDDHGGRFVDWNADFDRAPGQGIPYEISQEFRLAAPAVGTYTLGALTPTTFAAPTQWPAAWTALCYRDDPRIALSTGGTLTITNYLAPTDEYYGEIDGTLDAPLALWTNPTTLSGDTAHVTARFAVQLWPLGGIPASRNAPLP
jgi:hypothetical protein